MQLLWLGVGQSRAGFAERAELWHQAQSRSPLLEVFISLLESNLGRVALC